MSPQLHDARKESRDRADPPGTQQGPDRTRAAQGRADGGAADPDCHDVGAADAEAARLRPDQLWSARSSNRPSSASSRMACSARPTSCPTATKVQFLVGYRGLLDLARRSGSVQAVEARVVYEKDAFKYAFGLKPLLEHIPATEEDRGAVAFVYAVVHLRDGTPQWDVMSRGEIEAHRKQYSRAATDGPWITSWDEMAKKTVLRRVLKLCPASVELQRAVALDERAEAGVVDDEPAEDGAAAGEAGQAGDAHRGAHGRAPGRRRDGPAAPEADDEPGRRGGVEARRAPAGQWCRRWTTSPGRWPLALPASDRPREWAASWGWTAVAGADPPRPANWGEALRRRWAELGSGMSAERGAPLEAIVEELMVALVRAWHVQQAPPVAGPARAAAGRAPQGGRGVPLPDLRGHLPQARGGRWRRPRCTAPSACRASPSRTC